MKSAKLMSFLFTKNIQFSRIALSFICLALYSCAGLNTNERLPSSEGNCNEIANALMNNKASPLDYSEKQYGVEKIVKYKTIKDGSSEMQWRVSNQNTTLAEVSSIYTGPRTGQNPYALKELIDRFVEVEPSVTHVKMYLENAKDRNEFDMALRHIYAQELQNKNPSLVVNYENFKKGLSIAKNEFEKCCDVDFQNLSDGDRFLLIYHANPKAFKKTSVYRTFSENGFNKPCTEAIDSALLEGLNFTAAYRNIPLFTIEGTPLIIQDFKDGGDRMIISMCR